MFFFRFHPVIISEPTPEQTFMILKNSKPKLEQFYHVTIGDTAIQTAIDLANKYIPHRFFPDKGLDILEEAASNLSMQLFIEPPKLRKYKEKIYNLKLQKEMLLRLHTAHAEEQLQGIESKLNQLEQKVSSPSLFFFFQIRL